MQLAYFLSALVCEIDLHELVLEIILVLLEFGGNPQNLLTEFFGLLREFVEFDQRVILVSPEQSALVANQLGALLAENFELLEMAFALVNRVLL